MDERDPGADTAMFRAFVERGDANEPVKAPTTNYGMWAAIAVAVIVVLAILVLVLA